MLDDMNFPSVLCFHRFMGHEGPESGAIAVHDLVMVDPFITKERGRCAPFFLEKGPETKPCLVWFGGIMWVFA